MDKGRRREGVNYGVGAHGIRNCVAYKNVFRKITFLPRDCSASLMFATRDLPT